MSASLARKSEPDHRFTPLTKEGAEVVERQLGELIATVKALGDRLERIDTATGHRLTEIENSMEKIQLLIAETHGMTKVLRWVTGIVTSLFLSGVATLWWAADKWQWFTRK